MKQALLQLFLDVPVGILGGLYSGMIVSRYARFAELRNEVLRIVRSINYIQESSAVVISDDEDVSKLVLVSSDLFFLKHKKAAERVNLISSKIAESSYAARLGRVDSEEYGKLVTDCQYLARTLPPNKRVLWSLWGNI